MSSDLYNPDGTPVTPGELDPTVSYYEKVDVTCSKHPTKRWFTKNISGRTHFYAGDLSHHHKGQDGFSSMACMMRNQGSDQALSDGGYEQEECTASSSVWPCKGYLKVIPSTQPKVEVELHDCK